MAGHDVHADLHQPVSCVRYVRILSTACVGSGSRVRRSASVGVRTVTPSENRAGAWPISASRPYEPPTPESSHSRAGARLEPPWLAHGSRRCPVVTDPRHPSAMRARSRAIRASSRADNSPADTPSASASRQTRASSRSRSATRRSRVTGSSARPPLRSDGFAGSPTTTAASRKRSPQSSSLAPVCRAARRHAFPARVRPNGSLVDLPPAPPRTRRRCVAGREFSLSLPAGPPRRRSFAQPRLNVHVGQPSDRPG